MADGVDATAQDAVDRVIRSFTDADVALRDLLASAESFKEATTTIDGARGDLATSRTELETARTELVRMAESISTVLASMTVAAEQLRGTAEELRGVDQDRIWAGFDVVNQGLATHDTASRDQGVQTVATIREVTDDAAGRLAGAEASLKDLIRQTSSDSAASVTASITAMGAQAEADLERRTAELRASFHEALAAAEATRQASHQETLARHRTLERRVMAVVAGVGAIALLGVIVQLIR